MKKVLQLTTSLFSGDGQSSRMAQAFVDSWKQRHPEDTVAVRDLAREPVPHLTGERFAAFITPPEKRTAEQKLHVAYSDTLIEELRSADVIVLGLPMYNFGVPSTLKAYFDHVARAGVTFRYTANGPVGLLEGKKAYVLAARGGNYIGTPKDTQSGYVRDFLNFIGISDVEFVYAEGLAISPELKQNALSRAQENIERLAA